MSFWRRLSTGRIEKSTVVGQTTLGASSECCDPCLTCAECNCSLRTTLGSTRYANVINALNERAKNNYVAPFASLLNPSACYTLPQLIALFNEILQDAVNDGTPWVTEAASLGAFNTWCATYIEAMECLFGLNGFFLCTNGVLTAAKFLSGNLGVLGPNVYYQGLATSATIDQLEAKLAGMTKQFLRKTVLFDYVAGLSAVSLEAQAACPGSTPPSGSVVQRIAAVRGGAGASAGSGSQGTTIDTMLVHKRCEASHQTDFILGYKHTSAASATLTEWAVGSDVAAVNTMDGVPYNFPNSIGTAFTAHHGKYRRYQHGTFEQPTDCGSDHLNNFYYRVAPVSLGEAAALGGDHTYPTDWQSPSAQNFNCYCRSNANAYDVFYPYGVRSFAWTYLP